MYILIFSSLIFLHAIHAQVILFHRKTNYSYMMGLIKHILTVLVAVILLFCDAPRHNPLDPESNNYRFGRIEGILETYRVPHQPISGAEVYWENASLISETDQNGRFLFSSVKPDNGWLFFHTNYYFKDSLFITWNGKREHNIKHYLNVIPAVDSLVFYSSILNLYNDLQLILLSIKVRIDDPDNDVDSVYVISPGLGLKSYLHYDLETQFFSRELSMQDLGINSPESVIGHVFDIYVKDRLNNRIRLSSDIIKRIIKEQVELISPGSHVVVGPTPTLRWIPVNPGFPLEYRIEIYTDEMNLAWHRDHVSDKTSSLTLAHPLQAEKYRWAVWIIDEFQNRSRSKYKSFEVQVR
jgi:hypothetical protein